MVSRLKVVNMLQKVMKMIRLLPCVLMLWSTTTLAEWEQTAKEGNVTFYHDKSSIKRVGRFIEMWTLVSYQEPPDDSVGNYLSAKAQNKYDCSNENWAGIAVYYYSGSLGSGKLIQSDVMPGNLSWDLIVSETVSAKNWALACGKH